MPEGGVLWAGHALGLGWSCYHPRKDANVDAQGSYQRRWRIECVSLVSQPASKVPHYLSESSSFSAFCLRPGGVENSLVLGLHSPALGTGLGFHSPVIRRAGR